MKRSRPLAALLLGALFLVVLGCSSGPTEKDIVGRWESIKLPNLWMEFYPDMTCTGGKWSVTKDGRVKLVNPDGKEFLADLKDGKLIFPDLGDKGILVKEPGKKP